MRKILAEYLVNRLAHIRIQVHRIDKIHLRILPGQVLDSGTHMDESITEVLPAMTRDQHQSLASGQTVHVIPRT